MDPRGEVLYFKAPTQAKARAKYRRWRQRLPKTQVSRPKFVSKAEDPEQVLAVSVFPHPRKFVWRNSKRRRKP